MLAHTPWRQVLLAISTRSHPILGHFLEFWARWLILMQQERDDFTDSKCVPLRHRTFEQFDTSISLSIFEWWICVAAICDKKPTKS